MENSLIQTRIDTELKNEAVKLFDTLGLDMSTAIKIFLKKCLQEGGIPFDIKVNKSTYQNREGMQVIMDLRKSAEENGLLGMSLDEINAEISASRSERKSKRGE